MCVLLCQERMDLLHPRRRERPLRGRQAAARKGGRRQPGIHGLCVCVVMWVCECSCVSYQRQPLSPTSTLALSLFVPCLRKCPFCLLLELCVCLIEKHARTLASEAEAEKHAHTHAVFGRAWLWVV